MNGESFSMKLGKELEAWNHGGRAVTLRTTVEPGRGYRLDLECQNQYWRLNHAGEEATVYSWSEAEDQARATRSEMGIKGCLPEIWECPICEMVRKAESLETDTRAPDTGEIRGAWPPDHRHLPARQLPIFRLLELLGC